MSHRDAQAEDLADRLDKVQAEAVLILHATEPTRVLGDADVVFKTLQVMGLAAPMHGEWLLTELGQRVQDILLSGEDDDVA